MTPTLRTAWLEITGRCNLTCTHCYADSSPRGGHGSMTLDDWAGVLGQLADLDTRMVQIIGGEPTMHPHLDAIIDYAHRLGLDVEVYSNLTHITDPLWQLFSDCGVRLATSWYSDDPAEHEAITGGRGSHARTLASIRRARDLGIPVRAGLVRAVAGQRTGQAVAQVTDLGIPAPRLDTARAVGRAADGRDLDAQLCGRCGDQRVAIGPDGQVTPCVIGRHLIAGNVRETPLADILTGDTWAALLARVPAPAASACKPSQDGSDCQPAETEACDPAYD